MSRELYKMRERSVESGKFSAYCDQVRKDINRVAEMVYHSNSLEGSTLSEGDTLRVLTSIHVDNEIHSQQLSGNYTSDEISDAGDLAEAVEFVYDSVDEDVLTEDFILNIHSMACKSDATQDAGIYKNFDNYTMHNGEKKYYLPADKVEGAMSDLIETYNDSLGTLEEIATLVLDFIHIHPFADGNGRVSRLLLNWSLMAKKFPPILIKVEEKEKYIGILHEYGRSGDPTEFTEFIEEKLIEVYETMLQ